MPKTLTLDGEKDTTLEVTVARANAKHGIMRYRLMLREEDKTDDEDLRYVRVYIYPALVAGTTQVVGMAWPPASAEQIAALPEDTVTTWLQAIYDLNPSWEPRRPDESQKKG